MAEMERGLFVSRRRKLANAIYEMLKANPPEDSVSIDEPDDIGATGVDFGESGYLLVQVEDGTLEER